MGIERHKHSLDSTGNDLACYKNTCKLIFFPIGTLHNWFIGIGINLTGAVEIWKIYARSN